jgi:hypothetical protein
METAQEKMNNMFFGVYMIIPGQFPLLDNQFISIDRQNLKIIVRGPRDTVYNYSINDTKQLYYKGAPIKALEVKLDNLTTTNATGPNNLQNLLTMALGIRPPTIVYITFDQETGLFSLKNSQRSTIFTLQKMDD